MWHNLRPEQQPLHFFDWVDIGCEVTFGDKSARAYYVGPVLFGVFFLVGFIRFADGKAGGQIGVVDVWWRQSGLFKWYLSWGPRA